jgi:hypothetical protein
LTNRKEVAEKEGRTSKLMHALSIPPPFLAGEEREGKKKEKGGVELKENTEELPCTDCTILFRI